MKRITEEDITKTHIAITGLFEPVENHTQALNQEYQNDFVVRKNSGYSQIYNALRHSISDDDNDKSNSYMYLRLGTQYYLTLKISKIDPSGEDAISARDLKRAKEAYARFFPFAENWIESRKDEKTINANEIILKFIEQENQITLPDRNQKIPDYVASTGSNTANKTFNVFPNNGIINFSTEDKQLSVLEGHFTETEDNKKIKKQLYNYITISHINPRHSDEYPLSLTEKSYHDAICTLYEEAQKNNLPPVFDLETIWKLANKTNRRPSQLQIEEARTIIETLMTTLIAQDYTGPYNHYVKDNGGDRARSIIRKTAIIPGSLAIFIRESDDAEKVALQIDKIPPIYEHDKLFNRITRVPLDVARFEDMQETKTTKGDNVYRFNGKYYLHCQTEPSITPDRAKLKEYILYRIPMMLRYTNTNTTIPFESLYEAVAGNKEKAKALSRNKKQDIREYVEHSLAHLARCGYIRDFQTVRNKSGYACAFQIILPKKNVDEREKIKGFKTEAKNKRLRKQAEQEQGVNDNGKTSKRKPKAKSL